MKAIEIQGGRLVWSDTSPPLLGDGEVRIEVRASAVDRADLADLVQGAGANPPPGASPILGLECSGVGSEIAAGVSGFEIGDQECGLLAGGRHPLRSAADPTRPTPTSNAKRHGFADGGGYAGTH